MSQTFLPLPVVYVVDGAFKLWSGLKWVGKKVRGK